MTTSFMSKRLRNLTAVLLNWFDCSSDETRTGNDYDAPVANPAAAAQLQREGILNALVNG